MWKIFAIVVFVFVVVGGITWLITATRPKLPPKIEPMARHRKQPSPRRKKK